MHAQLVVRPSQSAEDVRVVPGFVSCAPSHGGTAKHGFPSVSTEEQLCRRVLERGPSWVPIRWVCSCEEAHVLGAHTQVTWITGESFFEAGVGHITCRSLDAARHVGRDHGVLRHLRGQHGHPHASRHIFGVSR